MMSSADFGGVTNEYVSISEHPLPQAIHQSGPSGASQGSKAGKTTGQGPTINVNTNSNEYTYNLDPNLNIQDSS